MKKIILCLSRVETNWKIAFVNSFKVSEIWLAGLTVTRKTVLRLLIIIRSIFVSILQFLLYTCKYVWNEILKGTHLLRIYLWNLTTQFSQKCYPFHWFGFCPHQRWVKNGGSKNLIKHVAFEYEMNYYIFALFSNKFGYCPHELSIILAFHK